MEERDIAEPETTATVAEEQTAPAEQDTPPETTAPEGDGQPDIEKTDGDNSAQADPAAKDAPRPSSNRVQQRISQLTSKNHRLKERIARLENELREQKVPDYDSFDSEDDYQDAIREHQIRQAVKKASLEESRAEIEAAESESREGMQRSFVESVMEFKKEYRDFDQVVKNANIPLTQELADALMMSDNGPALLYNLSKNPDRALELLDMPPTRMAIELGRMEAKLAGAPAPPPKRTTNAPPPVNPLNSGRSPVPTNPETEPTRDYMKRRIEEMRGIRGGR